MIMIQKIPQFKFKPLGLLLGVGIIACGCGSPAQETAAHKIADVLPQVIGPAQHYDVQVDGDPFALTRGRARAVHIQGQEVQIAPTLTLDTLNVDARDVSFSRETRRLENIGSTSFTATLGQTNLSAYLAQAKPLLPGLVVTLGESDVQVRVPVVLLGIQTTAALTGTFIPSTSEVGKLDFQTDSAHLGIVPLPSALMNLAIGQINPLVDLTHLRVPLNVSHVGVVRSHLTLDGSADLNGLVKPEKGIQG
jgi:hypothetical protein